MASNLPDPATDNDVDQGVRLGFGLAGQSGKPFLRWAGSKRKIAALA